MANIWLDRENMVDRPPLSVKKGLGLLSSAAKPGTKKNVLGNINNVIHNKQSATPFRGNRPLKPDVFSSSSKSLCKDVLRKAIETKLNSTPACVATPKVKVTAKDEDDMDLLDYMDICCNKKPEKTLPELWSEDHTFKDNVVRELVNALPGARFVADEFDVEPIVLDNYKDEFDDIVVGKLDEMYPYMNTSEDFNDEVTLPDLSMLDLSF